MSFGGACCVIHTVHWYLFVQQKYAESSSGQESNFR